uniref:Uncharacterized protein n=1 Tax=Anguilla anguilla TaxID=7936 RepID=A0A0E9TE52_ANGAN
MNNLILKKKKRYFTLDKHWIVCPPAMVVWLWPYTNA